MKYDLSHLTQNNKQDVIGPIQDDEALFLYSLIVGKKIKTVFEIGGGYGDSANNFLKAVGPHGIVFSCDLNPVPIKAPNHKTIIKNALHLNYEDFLGYESMLPFELVFFDCHDYVQMDVYNRLRTIDLITDFTVLALHDTNTHPQQFTHSSYQIADKSWVHQPVERKMVNDFVDLGYHAFCLHTRSDAHSLDFPFRHGVTVMSKFSRLDV